MCGLNAVNQIISSRPKSVKSLHVGEVLNTRIESIVDEAEKNKIKISKEDPEFFEKKLKILIIKVLQWHAIRDQKNLKCLSNQ